MKLDPVELQRLSAQRGYSVDDIEKAIVLMSILQGICNHADLGSAFALTGGAALNFFHANLPRHSRDLDINYVEDVSRETMLVRRDSLEAALHSLCKQLGVNVRRVLSEHAGGTWSCRFEDHTGRSRNVSLDVSWIARVPLWPVRRVDGIHLGTHSVRNMQLLSIEEITVGKILALLGRSEPRDVFDASMLFARSDFKLEAIRTGFIALSLATRDLDLREIDPETMLRHDPRAVRSGLARLLVRGSIPTGSDGIAWVTAQLDACREVLREMLRLRPAEVAFLEAALDQGEVRADLLECDPPLRDRISRHPAIQWRALNIQRHAKGERDASA